MRLTRSCAVVALSLTVLAAPAPAPAQVTSELFVSGLDHPVYVTAPPGDTERLFVVEWKGKVRIVKNGVLLPDPFLDIEDIVFWDNFERGLLGMAFDPDYDVNGWFYLYFINAATPIGNSVIRRYTVSADPDSADRSTQASIFTLTQAGGDHNGGHIEFGPNGHLWIALGDGGVAPNTRAQELDNLFGKILRINPYMDDYPADLKNNYAIPPTNPFVADSTAMDEIWSYGLRNPYRFAFDEATGDLYIGDVGHGFWEEVDYEPAGNGGAENYGWPFKEGHACFNPPKDCDPGGLTPPVHVYPHPTGFAISAGRVYHGSAIPELQGHFFFGDFITDRTWTLRMDNGVAVDLREHTIDLDPGGGLSVDNIVAYGKDAAGELYICDLYQGEVFKIIPHPDVDAPIVEPPTGLAMSRPAPNPFAAETRLTVRLAAATDLNVGVYSTAGRLVRELRTGPASGTILVTWDGRDEAGAPAPAGVYMLRAATPDQVLSQRITRVR